MSTLEKGIFRRTQLLLGDPVMDRLASVRVIVFGVGGVGSWCAESLVRSGICHVTIVDSDRVCVTNVNRQLMATAHTVGQVKVEALRRRLLDINPDADITAIQDIFTADTADTFALETYDYIIDAIDSLKDKVLLIQMATRTRATFYSSMGAALKLDPTRIEVAEFWKVKGCPLARALRTRFKRKDVERPHRKFLCVYSEELLENKGRNTTCGTEACLCPKVREMSQAEAEAEGMGRASLVNHEWCSSKAQINGTLAHITAMFGFMLAGLVMRDVVERVSSTNEK